MRRMLAVLIFFVAFIVFPLHVHAAELPGLVAAYGFDLSNNTLADSSANGFHLTCGPTCPTYTATGGHSGGAFNFAGTNNYFVAPSESSFDFTTALTVGFWMKNNVFDNGWEGIVTKGDSAWAIERYNTTRNVSFSTLKSGSWSQLRASTTVDNNAWHHVAVTYDGTAKKVYIDGSLKTTQAYSGSINQNDFALTIGSNLEYLSGDYSGYLDDVRIFNRALTAAEITTIKNSPVTTPVPSPSPSILPSPSPSVVPSPSPSVTPSATPSATPSPSPIPSPTPSPSVVASPSPSTSPLPTPFPDGIYPLKVASDSARYLVTQSGQPFLMNGDAPWALINQLSTEDAEIYLQDAAAKKINTLIVTLADARYTSRPPANYYGEVPFVNGKFTSPNEAYFAHADTIIALAQRYGMNVILAPMYLGCCSDGWWSTMDQNNTIQDVAWYGTYVGNRYKNFPNIIYSWGNDTNPCGYASTVTTCSMKDKQLAMITATAAADPTHLHTYHGSPEYSSADLFAPASNSWLGLNSTYTYNPVHTKVLADYNRTDIKPFFLFESHYERDWDNAAPEQVWWQMYSAILSGASGHAMGNNPIWHFNSVGGTDWKTHLNDAGRIVLPHLYNLFTSRDWVTLEPDQYHTTLTSGYGADSTYVPAALAANHRTFIAYFRYQPTVTIDMTRISGSSAYAWWFNPQTGTSTFIGTYPTTGTIQLTPPSAAGWVLVIDDAAAGFPIPGTSITPSPAPSPSIIPSPVPSPSPSVVPSPSPIVPPAALSITHDMGTLGEYTTTFSTAGELSATSTSALAGTAYGMQAIINDGDAQYGYITLPTASTTGVTRARFYIDPHGLVMNDLDQITVLMLINSQATTNYGLVKLMKISGAYYLRGVMIDDNGLHQETAAFPITDAPHYIEIMISRATTTESSDATYSTWIDGVPQTVMTGVDSYTAYSDLKYVAFGAISLSGPSMRGSIYLDELAVNYSGTEIGPVAGQPSPVPSPMPSPTPSPSPTPLPSPVPSPSPSVAPSPSPSVIPTPSPSVKPQPVAAYSFNEGTGTVVGDVTGHNLVGTLLNGPMWTTSGKYGSALTFDGSNDRVSILDHNLLDLTTTLTAEAWVYPTANYSAWKTILMKEGSGGFAYALYLNYSDTKPVGYIYAGGTEREVMGTTNLPLNTWSHVALTYDGLQLKLYVNGTQNATSSYAGSMSATTGSLSIGANSIWNGEAFKGTIDDVRIYNTVLTPVDIVADMNTSL